MSFQHVTDYIETESIKTEGCMLPVQFVNPVVRSAKAYTPPLFEKEGCRLYMNENLFGPSPKCLDVLRNTLPEQLSLYPYGGDQFIVQALAERTGVKVEQVMVNQGAAALIQQIFQSVLGNGDTVFLPQPGWDYYRSVAETLGARIFYYNIVEADGRYEFHIDRMINVIREKHPKIVVVTSPNMPTGNMISLSDLTRLARCTEKGILFLDEAYYGFTLREPFSESKLLSEHPNVVIMRTFSKLYGLASIRLGYAICDSGLCKMFKKTAPLFGVSWLSQQVVKAALDDVDYYEELKLQIISIREKFRRQINQIEGMWAYPSEANFVLIDMTGWPSEAIVKYCRDNGYLIRDCKGYKLKNHLRVSIGKEEYMDDIISLFLEFVHAYKQ